MQTPDIDRNLQYLALTVLLLLPVVAAHNLAVPESDRSFAMCDHSTACQGATVGNTCLGIEQRQVSCVDAQTAPEHRRVEAECGLDAQAICNANPSLDGTEWTDHPNATFRGTRCSQWAAQNQKIDLLKCGQTTDSIQHWSGT